jgi:hypothetical protein
MIPHTAGLPYSLSPSEQVSARWTIAFSPQWSSSKLAIGLPEDAEPGEPRRDD